MKPLKVIYWTRACLGVVIGIICALYVYVSNGSNISSIYTLLTGISFALLFYTATYYIMKPRFLAQVEKPTKLVTQGVGMYLFAWIVSWTLIVTFLLPFVSVSIYDIQTDGLAEGDVFWVVAWNSANEIAQNLTTTSGTVNVALLAPGTYTFELGTSANYNVTNQNQQLSIGWLDHPNIVFNVTKVSS